jgi:aryl-alcohol dehydrogenase-like predicted oxidoreductase
LGLDVGGTDEAESVATIRAALDHGINVIDTAPIYGFGHSEEIVGKAIAEGGLRSRVFIATKVGLEWRDGKIFRNASRERIMREIDDSLRRLGTDHIDIYQVHWPDPGVPVEETAEAMLTLFKRGTIRAIGGSNFSVAEMDRFRRVAPIHVLRSPYNISERGIEADVLPYCHENRIATFGYGALCRGLLSGRMRPDTASAVTICAEWTQNSNSLGSVSISPPCSASISSPKNVSVSASFTWRSVGFSTKVSPPRCGARAILVSYSQWTA